MKNSDRNVYIKLYIAAGLCIAIAIGLSVLAFDRISDHADPPKEPQFVAVETPTPTPTFVPISTPTPTPSPTPKQDSDLVKIVNKNEPLGEYYVPNDLVDVTVTSEGVQQLRKEAADALVPMFSDAAKDGVELVVISGYRSYAMEVEIQRSYIDLYGEVYADLIDCHPGMNEHQLGLAVDLGITDNTCRLDQCFADTSASTWLMGNAWKYGWILRYPEGKEDITGIMYSPWNYRYVGKEAAVQLHDSGLTMEEYYKN